jgi:hypothetical protein
MRMLDERYNILFGNTLPRPEFAKIAICVDISAAATEFFLGDGRNYWDIRTHFGSLRAPVPLGWYEFAMPAHMRTETGVQPLLPPDTDLGEVRVGYRVTHVALPAQRAARVLKEDPLPAMVQRTAGAPHITGLAERQQVLRTWRRRGAAVQTLLFCEVVMFGPDDMLINGFFGLYLDAQGQPLPELTCAALSFPLLELGDHAQTLLFPLFYALSALNCNRAYLQNAAGGPGVAQPLPFAELVMRTPHVPATYAN